MQKWTKHIHYILKNSEDTTLIGILTIHLAHCFLNPNPKNFIDAFTKSLLKHFHYLRRIIMEHVTNHLELDIYNLQAIEILEKAGISEPTDRQITTIERLLKAT
jgi:hypothetical protein